MHWLHWLKWFVASLTMLTSSTSGLSTGLTSRPDPSPASPPPHTNGTSTMASGAAAVSVPASNAVATQEQVKQFTQQMADLMSSWSRNQQQPTPSPNLMDPRLAAAGLSFRAAAVAAAAAFQRPPAPPHPPPQGNIQHQQQMQQQFNVSPKKFLFDFFQFLSYLVLNCQLLFSCEICRETTTCCCSLPFWVFRHPRFV